MVARRKQMQILRSAQDDRLVSGSANIHSASPNLAPNFRCLLPASKKTLQF
jgi:hypothetical protein